VATNMPWQQHLPSNIQLIQNYLLMACFLTSQLSKFPFNTFTTGSFFPCPMGARTKHRHLLCLGFLISLVKGLLGYQEEV
jgi:hypothetical protein